jgi:hypothetical protein
MALNPNHTFEELGEVKCSIVEKNCEAARAAFLKELLEFNHFTVVVMKSPPPKTAPKPAAEEHSENPPKAAEPAETFTVGVNDLSFNFMNAIYNRELKTPGGKIVDPLYWKQVSTEPGEGWYWKN